MVLSSLFCSQDKACCARQGHGDPTELVPEHAHGATARSAPQKVSAQYTSGWLNHIQGMSSATAQSKDDESPSQFTGLSPLSIKQTFHFTDATSGDDDSQCLSDQLSPDSAHKPTIGTRLLEAAHLRECGHTAEAIEIYHQVLQTDSQFAECALLGIADCHADQGSLSAALAAVQDLLKSKPDDIEANLRAAELTLMSAKSVDLAESFLKRAAMGSPRGQGTRLRILCAMAEIALAREDYEQAMQHAAAAVCMDIASMRALLLLGVVQLNLAKYDMAIHTLESVLRAPAAQMNGFVARHAYSNVHALLAQAHERKGEYNTTLVHAGRALESEPHSCKVRVTRAMAKYWSGRSVEAVHELTDILEKNPRQPAVRLQLGYIQLSCMDPHSIAMLEAIQSMPAAGNVLGASRAYLALALYYFCEDQTHDLSARMKQLLQEGLSLHRNLHALWRQIETSISRQAAHAIQLMRCICDLDLTTLQAETLLSLLARASGRKDLVRMFEAPQVVGNVQTRLPSPRPQRFYPASGDPEVVAATLLSSSPRGRHSSSKQRSGSFTHRARTPSGKPFGARPYDMWGASSTLPASRTLPTQSRSRSSIHSSTFHIGVKQNAPSLSASAKSFPQMMPSTSTMRRALSMDVGIASRREGSANGSLFGQRSEQFLELHCNEIIQPQHLAFDSMVGSGGSAQVFRGRWKNEEVAIKKISSSEHIEAMGKEINALRNLSHPALVRFIGACLQPPWLLIVMEFLPGKTLFERIFYAKAEAETLSPLHRSRISMQVADGVQFLHSHLVVHRDLKSMNILLDSAGRAKICDFGLAQPMALEETHISRKIQGEGGSPRYMAPELFSPDGKITEKVDIWAFGCILIELFASILAYADCITMAEMKDKMLVQKEPPRIPAVVPLSLAALIHGCHHFDETKRPSAPDLLKQLIKTVRVSDLQSLST